MIKVCIVQPLLTKYALPVFLELSKYCKVDIVYSPVCDKFGYGETKEVKKSGVRYFCIPTYKPFGDRIGMIQTGIVKYMFYERPDSVIVFANPRYLSFWLVLILGRLLGIDVHAHGHGLYKKRQVNFFIRVMYSTILTLVKTYICYAPIVKKSFMNYGFKEQKLYVAENSLVNEFLVRPEEKTGKELGVLFIGRLREGCNLGLLMRVMEKLREDNKIDFSLHIIGDGSKAPIFLEQGKGKPWLHFYGQIYDYASIQEISRNCFIGCYPGNAGLSVVHMMSMSLPPVTHNDIPAHQGPEPSYIRDHDNELLFDHKDAEDSLFEVIKFAVLSHNQVKNMQERAFEEYEKLVNPSLAERFFRIIKNR